MRRSIRRVCKGVLQHGSLRDLCRRATHVIDGCALKSFLQEPDVPRERAHEQTAQGEVDCGSSTRESHARSH